MLEGRELHEEIDTFNSKGLYCHGPHVFILPMCGIKKMTGMDYISYLYTQYITVYIDKYIKKEM